MELKRYRVTVGGTPFTSSTGVWCLYEDAAAEIARLKARVAELEEAADCIQCERDGLKQGVEFWKSAAEAQRRKNCDECVRIAGGRP